MEKAVPRLITFLLALVFMAMGVVLSTKAVLGTSPISSVPFVLSLGTSMSLGTATVVFNLVIIALGILIMRKNYRLIYLSGLVMAVIFSVFCDIFADAFSFISVNNYILQWLLIVLSALVLSFGIALELAANVSMMPGEYLVSFVVFVTGKEFGSTKVVFDISCIVTAVILSLLFFGTLNGVREGTVFAAVTVGFIVRAYTGALKRSGFYEWAGHEDITAKK